LCLRQTAVVAVGNYTVPQPEIDALFDLYQATNGPGWKWRTTPVYTDLPFHIPDVPFDLENATLGIPWNFTDLTRNNPCRDRWQGINCTTAYPFEVYHIYIIHLTAVNLIGTLPESIGLFPELAILSLTANKITGSIPNNLKNPQ
jgi:hypothetical protein